MMTGTRTMRVSRGRYVSAGYAEKRTRPAADERELYISADPAGSRENLRDLNRTGYRSEQPWRDTPDPALQKATPETQRRAPARKAQPPESSSGRLIGCWRKSGGIKRA
ncbi:MAG: hypothetical protein ACLUI3_09570 [Christensenellales bacterium]